MSKEFFDIGCDYLLTGENELAMPEIYNAIKSNNSLSEIEGLIGRNFSNNKSIIDDIDNLRVPKLGKISSK